MSKNAKLAWLISACDTMRYTNVERIIYAWRFRQEFPSNDAAIAALKEGIAPEYLKIIADSAEKEIAGMEPDMIGIIPGTQFDLSRSIPRDFIAALVSLVSS